MTRHHPTRDHVASGVDVHLPGAAEAQPRVTRRSYVVVARYLKAGIVALAITLLALALRLYRLDARSFWLDEIVTAYSVRFDNLAGLFRHLAFWYDNMPGIFLLTWLTRDFGGSELVVRLPFALAGTLNVYALYRLGKAVIGPSPGLIAAFVLALSPFAVWYSQEARQYAFLMLFTTLQMLYAYEVAVNRRATSAIWLAVVSILNLYTGYLALPVTLAAFAFVGAVYLVLLLKKPRIPGLKSRLRLIAPGAGAVLAVALAYLPWLPFFLYFSARSGADMYAETSSSLWSMLGSLGFSTLLIGLLMLGLAAGALCWLRGGWSATLLLLLFLLIPVATFWLRFQDALLNLTPRYFACIVPPLTLIVAMGVELLARNIARLILRVLQAMAHRPAHSLRNSLRSTYALVLTVLLIQAVPTLAASYAVPKDDYRGAANMVVDSSPPDSVVLAMHTGEAVFQVESLQYYFWRRGSPVLVVDAAKLDLQTVVQIAGGRGLVWGADFAPQALSEYAQVGLSATHLGHFDLLRLQAGPASPLDQARQLLAWGAQTEPRLLTSLAFLNGYVEATFGADLLPTASSLAPAGQQPLNTGTTPDQWIVPPGASLGSDQQAFQLTPGGQEVNITLTTHQLQPGHAYVLLFSYRSANLQGTQRVYVSTHGASLAWLDTFPDGVGFPCDPAQDWVHQGFAFTVPPVATTAIIWLRATGEGTAYFTDIQLRELP